MWRRQQKACSDFDCLGERGGIELNDTRVFSPLHFDVRCLDSEELGSIHLTRFSGSELRDLQRAVIRERNALVERVASLEETLPKSTLASKAYRASKMRQEWRFEVVRRAEPLVGETASFTALRPRLSELSQPRRVHGPDALSRALSHAKSLLLIGPPVIGGALSEHLAANRSDDADRVVSCGDGGAPPFASDAAQRRPKFGSFFDWMARATHADRLAISAYCLSVTAGRDDVELLHGRMLPGQTIIAEPGSAAKSWLDAIWRGTVHPSENATIYSEPCRNFLAPTHGGDAIIQWPKISVITVSFNQAEYLERCLKSVLGQEYPNLEYIVIDACSTDGSRDILERYRSDIDTLIIEPDDGQSDGLNKGFNLATGEILTWINSDDELAPLALIRAAIAFQRSGADIVAGSCVRIGESSDVVLLRHYSNLPTNILCPLRADRVTDWSNAWEKGDFFFQPEVLFTRDIWMRSGRAIKRRLHWAMDWDLWVRMAFAGAKVIRIPDVIGYSRVHDEQKTRADEAYLPQIEGLLEEYRQLLSAVERYEEQDVY